MNKHMKILHIPTGQYFIIAPVGDKGEYLMDTERYKTHWRDVRCEVSKYFWYRVWKYNKITDFYMDGNKTPYLNNKTEFALVD